MAQNPAMQGPRTAEQLREHYDIEKALARKLRQGSRLERPMLYAALYDELYRRVPHHPQLTRKSSPADVARTVGVKRVLLRPFLKPGLTFLEVGPGDCSLSVDVSKSAGRVYAVDVSDEITQRSAWPENFQLILSDGTSIPVPPASVDVAYSNQLMEHLHPDDALEQLQNIHRALVPGGVYLCITPNRLSGPHDISMYFDTTATGFHLKEYTTAELRDLFRRVGFSRVSACIGAKRWQFHVPLWPVALYESLLAKLPGGLRRAILRILPFRLLLGVGVVGIK